MDKINEFLSKLEEELKYLKPKDRNDIIKFYQDKINIQQDYGESVDKIIASLPSPSYIAQETYNTKGKGFVESRKKTLRKTQILKAILSSIVLLLVVFVGVMIYGYLGYACINLFKFIFNVFAIKGFLDILTIVLFSLLYICLILILMIYIFDLLYIIFTYFLVIVLDTLNTKMVEYKFLNFTLSGLIDSKKKILFKLIIVFLVAFILFGISNYSIKGYLYRSLNNVVNNEEKYEIKGDIQKIILNNSSLIVKVKVDSDASKKVRLILKSEFEKDLSYEVIDDSLKINSIEGTKYDVFGILDEPLPTLEIYIPAYMNVSDIEINLSEGFLDVENINKELNFTVNANLSTVTFTNTSINNININSFDSTISLENNKINDAVLKLNNGNYYSTKDIYKNIKLDTQFTKSIFQEATIGKMESNNKSAQAAILTSNIDELKFVVLHTESYINDSSISLLNIESNGTSTVSITRVISKISTSLLTNSGSIDVMLLKTPILDVKLQRGDIKLYYINKNNTTSIDNNSYINTYNEYNVQGIVNIDSSLANIEIGSSLFAESSIKLQEGKFTVIDAYFRTLEMLDKYCAVDLQDVDGVSFNAEIVGGNFSYYNTEKSNIKFTYTTSKNPILNIGENLKDGE